MRLTQRAMILITVGLAGLVPRSHHDGRRRIGITREDHS